MPGVQKRTKRVPGRMCLACRTRRPKWQLVRIVRTPEGSLEIDERGKKSGRGAYVCRSEECRTAGLTLRNLSRALRAEVSPDQNARLRQEVESILASSAHRGAAGSASPGGENA